LMYCDVNDVLRAQDALQKPHPRVGDDLLLDDSRIVCAQANVVLVLPRIAAMTGGADLRVDRAAVGDVGGFGTRREATGKAGPEQAKAKKSLLCSVEPCVVNGSWARFIPRGG